MSISAPPSPPPSLKAAEACSSSASKKSRQPTCALCNIHGVKVSLKGHKRYCNYTFCKCPKCALIVRRRLIMAKQVKLRRDQAEDERTGRRPISSATAVAPETVVTTPATPPVATTASQGTTSWASGSSSSFTRSTDPVPAPSSSSSPPPVREIISHHQVLHYLSTILSNLQLAPENAAVLLPTLKKYDFNLELTWSKIVGAQNQWLELCQQPSPSIWPPISLHPTVIPRSWGLLSSNNVCTTESFKWP